MRLNSNTKNALNVNDLTIETSLSWLLHFSRPFFCYVCIFRTKRNDINCETRVVLCEIQLFVRYIQLQIILLYISLHFFSLQIMAMGQTIVLKRPVQAILRILPIMLLPKVEDQEVGQLVLQVVIRIMAILTDISLQPLCVTNTAIRIVTLIIPNQDF